MFARIWTCPVKSSAFLGLNQDIRREAPTSQQVNLLLLFAGQEIAEEFLDGS